jgi:hypothetical protein
MQKIRFVSTTKIAILNKYTKYKNFELRSKLTYEKKEENGSCHLDKN